MPMRPLLEVLVLHHPDDIAGEHVVKELLHHFHGPAYAGLVGGSVEVYPRAQSWEVGAGPRSARISVTGDPSATAEFLAIFPVYSAQLFHDALSEGPWGRYITDLADLQRSDPEHVLVAPICPPELGEAPRGLRRLPYQQIRQTSGTGLLREVTQVLTQWLRSKTSAEQPPLSVFISHAKTDMRADAGDAVTAVRRVLEDAHLRSFFDAVDIQVAEDWAARLKKAAAADAMLIVRTDNYATREWTLKEATLAKLRDRPMVALLAHDHGEARGSFLLDNVPSVPYRRGRAAQTSIHEALLRLTDECLKHALWCAQRVFEETGNDEWYPARAPEPNTLTQRLIDKPPSTTGQEPSEQLTIVHPDPPLTHAELEELQVVAWAHGLTKKLTVDTPRTAAARLRNRPLQVDEADSDAGRLAISVSESEDLARLGLDSFHLELLVAEVGRAVLLAGGRLAYGGRLAPEGFTTILCDEVDRFGPDRRAEDASPSLRVTATLPGHRMMAPSEIDRWRNRYAPRCYIELLDRNGEVVAHPSPRDWAPATAPRVLSAMRRRVTAACDGRLLIGGKLRGFTGDMPGVVEEAIATIDAGKPLYLAAGFGGATAFVAQQLELNAPTWEPASYFPAGAADEALALARQQLSLRKEKLVPDGLSDEDKVVLARSHRPGDLGLVMGRAVAHLRTRSAEGAS